MRNSVKLAVYLAACVAIMATTLPAAAALGNAGCWKCVVDHDDCQWLTGICSNICEQVGHNQAGDGIWCYEEDVSPWSGGGNTECILSGGACVHTEVNGNDDPPAPGGGGWCPWGQAC